MSNVVVEQKRMRGFASKRDILLFKPDHHGFVINLFMMTETYLVLYLK